MPRSRRCSRIAREEYALWARPRPDADGDPTGFTAASGGGWKPEPGAEDLTLTGSPLTGTFTLKDGEGTTPTFAKVDPSATTWRVTSMFLPTTNSTSQVVSEKIPVGNTFLARLKYAIAPTSAVTQATCSTAPATKGCRVLEYVYANATTAGGLGAFLLDQAGVDAELEAAGQRLAVLVGQDVQR
ncbi:hypothetical protein ABZX65_27595 [Streptomyces sp. NPDC003300]|uniref:hypothetical protein n=1 Tax=unclassified Streptomyces TaxID=2593676 RepID=UPI0033BEA088